MQYGTLVNHVDDRLTNELDNFSHCNSITFNANDDTTPMDSEPIPSFMQILQNYFKTIDPVHVRRSQLCKFQPEKGQAMSVYAWEFQKLLDNADLKFATVVEVFAQMCINRCPKPDLRRKYLELPMTPNFSQIIAITRVHEGNLKGAPKPFNNYANANTQEPKSLKKKNTQKTSVAKQKPKTDGSYLGCICCGAVDHFPRDCKFISHKWTKCNLTGHSET